MNKVILNTALVLIPKKMQCKAVAHALNFIFRNGVLHFDEVRTLKLEVKDLKRSWVLKLEHSKFTPSVEKRIADITISANLEIILKIQECQQLIDAFNSGQIEVNASLQDKVILDKAVQKVCQDRLDALIIHCYAFLKLKPKPRFDIKTVTLAEVKTARDVDWLRDEAVKLETSNLSDALRLMEIAHQARPSGPFIKRKVEEYRTVLAQQ